MSDIVSTLGKLISTPQLRDAIHVAVAPVVATERLSPAAPVKFDNERSFESVRLAQRTPIGIIDPFLVHPVLPGQRCWMFLYPGTILSLRHDWTHPAFGFDEHPSVIWMHEFAEKYGRTSREMMSAARDWIENGERMGGGSELESEYVPDVFWDHYEILTGRNVKIKDRGSFFSCSC